LKFDLILVLDGCRRSDANNGDTNTTSSPSGQQQQSSRKADLVRIFLLLLRMAPVGTDLLITLNVPLTAKVRSHPIRALI